MYYPLSQWCLLWVGSVLGDLSQPLSPCVLLQVMVTWKSRREFLLLYSEHYCMGIAFILVETPTLLKRLKWYMLPLPSYSAQSHLLWQWMWTPRPSLSPMWQWLVALLCQAFNVVFTGYYNPSMCARLILFLCLYVRLTVISLMACPNPELSVPGEPCVTYWCRCVWWHSGGDVAWLQLFDDDVSWPCILIIIVL